MRKLWLLTFAICLAAATVPAGAEQKSPTGNYDTDVVLFKSLSPNDLKQLRLTSTTTRDNVDRYVKMLVETHELDFPFISKKKTDKVPDEAFKALEMWRTGTLALRHH
jgi:hypothetical protein